MPMDFPNLDSLRDVAKMISFREIEEGEDEEHFRNALANNIEPRDPVMAGEIRFKVGWDKWTLEQKKEHLFGLGFTGGGL